MTNNIHTLNFDSIIMSSKASSVKDVLKKLSQHTASLIGAPATMLFDQLSAHEKEESSGIGNGVAITHMRLPNLTKPFIIFMTLDHDVDFKAVDNELVDMVCLVLSPEFEGSLHLSRLSKISRWMNNQVLCNKLREAKDTDDIKMILDEVNNRKIAA